MRVNLIIKPNSKHREEVVTNDDGGLTVYTKQPVAKHFGVSKSQVSIVSGQTSKCKTISIEN